MPRVHHNHQYTSHLRYKQRIATIVPINTLRWLCRSNCYCCCTVLNRLSRGVASTEEEPHPKRTLRFPSPMFLRRRTQQTHPVPRCCCGTSWLMAGGRAGISRDDRQTREKLCLSVFICLHGNKHNYTAELR